MAALKNACLTYFPLGGRAEASRLAMVLGGIAFEDKRLAPSDWAPLKGGENCPPWGSMPILALEDGTVVNQSRAVLRFIGKLTGLYPSDDHVTAAYIDEMVDGMEDLQAKVNSTGQGLDDEAKIAARVESVASGNIAAQLGRIDARIAKVGRDGHAVGGSLTIADLGVYAQACSCFSPLFDGMKPEMLEPYKNIQAVRRTVANQPKVVEWYEKQAALPYWGWAGPRYQIYLDSRTA